MLRSRRNDVLAIFIILLLTLSFFHRILLHPTEMIFPVTDIFVVFSFWKKFFVESLVQFGQIPLWNPYQFSGIPFIANPSSGIFYPPNLLFFLFPTDLAFGYVFILDVFLLGAFTYFFARSIHLEMWSSLVVSIVMMFSGAITARIIPGHIIILDTIVWFPLLLFFYEKCIQTKGFQFGILAALPISLMIIGGHTQFALLGLCSGFLYFILRVISEKERHKMFFIIPFVSIVLGIGLSAIQLLPMIEFSKLSARSNGVSFDFASDFSLHPFQYLTALVPYFFGSPLDNTFWGKGNFHELALYIGIVPLLFVFVTIVFQRNKYTGISAIMAVFALLYAFGKYGFIFSFFYHVIPFFDSFRVPGRFLFVYVFFLSVLAGFGVQFFQKKKFLDKEKLFLKRFVIILFLISVCLVLAAVFIHFGMSTDLYEKLVLRNSFAVGINHDKLLDYLGKDIFLFSIVISIGTILLFLRIKNKINRVAFNIFIVLLIFSNLYIFGARFIDTKNPEQVFTSPKVIKLIKKDRDRYRVFDMTGDLYPYINRNGIESVVNVDASYLRSYRDFLWAIGPHKNWPYESFIQIEEINHPQFLSLLNTKYIVADKTIKVPGLEKVSVTGNHWLYKNNVMFERAFVVPQAKVMPHDTMLKVIQTQAVDLRETVVLEEKPSEKMVNKKGNYSLQITTYEPNKILLLVNASEPGYLVLSEIWYPGWKAVVNGKEVKIYKADYLLRSVHVNSGKNTVEFVYQPESYKIGMYITILSLVILLVCLLFKRKAL